MVYKAREIFARSAIAKARADTLANQAKRQMLADSQAARKAPAAATTMQKSAAPFTPTAGGPQLPPGPVQGGPISGPGAPLPQPGLTGGASSVPAGGSPSYGAPAGGGMGGMSTGYNAGAPATASYQGGTTGGTGGGMSGAMGMPDPSLLPAGAMFKKGGKVKAKKMASGGMTSKVSSASKRADGIAQRGKTKGRMC